MSISTSQSWGNGVKAVHSFKVWLTATTHSYDGINFVADGIATMNSVPIDVGLPSSGAGYYYRVTQFDTKLDYATTPYDSVELGISSPSFFGIGGTFYRGYILDKTSDQFAPAKKTNTSGFGLDYYENDTLILTADADDTNSGDSPVVVYITVEKVAL